MEKKMVVKRDGTEEEFDRNKLYNSIIGATATPDEAQTITTGVEEWVNGSRTPVRTIDIRARVVAALKSANPKAGELYDNYEKPQ